MQSLPSMASIRCSRAEFHGFLFKTIQPFLFGWLVLGRSLLLLGGLRPLRSPLCNRTKRVVSANQWPTGSLIRVHAAYHDVRVAAVRVFGNYTELCTWTRCFPKLNSTVHRVCNQQR
jgi:hypothetical protein